MNNLQQQISDKKFEIISDIKSLRVRHNELLGELIIELETTRNNYVIELEILSLNVANFIAISEGNGNDVSNCTLPFYTKINEVNLKLDELDLNLLDRNSTSKNISRQIGMLSRHIGSYRKVAKACKFQPSTTDKSGLNIQEVETCAANQIKIVDEEIEAARDSINSDIRNIKAVVRDLVINISSTIVKLIQEALHEFMICIK